MIGNKYNMFDYAYIEYGFPLIWAKNDIMNFSGAVNIWYVNLSALFIDFVFWLGCLVIGIILIIIFLSDYKKKDNVFR